MSTPPNYTDPKFQRFNSSLDDDGEITIAGYSFWPSKVLFDQDIAAYLQAYSEFSDQEYDDLKQRVFESYPSNIAYALRLSERGEGANDPVRKLLHLKDAWEAIVFVLYALVMGEVRHRNISLRSAQILNGHDSLGNPLLVPFNTDRLISDKIKQKIKNIMAVIAEAQNLHVGLKCESIDITLLDDLLALQDIRNDLSHHTTPTKEEAERELSQVLPIFRQMLFKTQFLEDCKILRFDNLGAECRCEQFNNHSLNKDFESIQPAPTETTYIIGLGQEQIFAQWESSYFSLSPFLHYLPDGSGHESYLCFYKGKKDSKYWYEPVKIRTERSFDHLQSRFDAETASLLTLLKP